jgi:AMP phosphorylase
MIIRAERPMGIDPRPTMMASIMSKKVAIGTTHLLVDIPLGRTTKTPDLASARDFAESIRNLGTILGIHIECAITRADQPLGRAIGPILEARECIEVLEGRDADPEIVDKACSIAGIILEMAGEKDGRARAEEILRSGKAHEKFLQIVKTQNGNPNLKSTDLIPGSFCKDVHAKRDGFVGYIDNHSLVAIAKATGAPFDPEGGIEMLHKVGDAVKEGDVLFRIYAGSKPLLERAIESARSRRPMAVVAEPPEITEGPMVVERIPTKEMLDLIRFRS